MEFSFLEWRPRQSLARCLHAGSEIFFDVPERVDLGGKIFQLKTKRSKLRHWNKSAPHTDTGIYHAADGSSHIDSTVMEEFTGEFSYV